MVDRRLLRTLVPTLLTALCLAGGALAGHAQDEDPPQVEPPVLAEAAADCHDGTARVKVWVDDAPEPWNVSLAALSGDFVRELTSVLDEDKGMYVAVFDDVPVGEYAVAIVGADRPSDGLRVVVRACTDPGPGQGALDVAVECRGGWGIATFQVTNPETGTRSSFTLAIRAPEDYRIPTLDPGLFVRITQNLFDDGSYVARLEDENGREVARKDFTVACAEGNAPALEVTSTCEGATARVIVGVSNPNRIQIAYTVRLKDQTQTVTVGGGQRGTVTFPKIADGRYLIKVTGGDTRADAPLTVDCVRETTTTPPTTTTVPVSTTPPGTTTAPPPQGSSGGGLASTGAAVGGLVGLGALVLGLGGALLVIARRRRAHQD
ncbi:MAG TPA: hypothetical protein VFV67_10825 [Actinophytocola sp.]|uniref:hypothetical protein n=1 Tax=Actinophytocola sp. TaxID=1872138 RepID=UPI002DB9C87A|nr:hypothetical protein [Actinophytocola sp.]HEU5471137.1 hypothetical protein [Actinophytocola sp.]